MAGDAAALLAGLTTVVLWGSAFVAIRQAGHTLAPGSIALGRLIVACAILTAVALLRRERLPSRGALFPIAAFGVLWLGVYSVALSAAERRVDAGTSAMVVNVGPLLIAVLAVLLLHEGFARRLFAGCCVAFAGCVLIGLATAGDATGGGSGYALLVVATLAYAFAVIVQKGALARASTFQVTWLGCVVATVACLPFTPALVHDATRDHAHALAWTVYLGVMPTALGFATWSFALARASAGRVASLNYLIPVVATALDWIALGERPPLLALGGGALCLVGVYLARRRDEPVTRRGGTRGTRRRCRTTRCGRATWSRAAPARGRDAGRPRA